MQELVFHNIKFRDIDWEVSLVLSSRSVGVLDEPLVSVHLDDNKWVIIQFIKETFKVQRFVQRENRFHGA